ncbi:MAG TPA: alcohol dehydrogenase catalytic domain-containing protein [Thermoanaerobaculia bacterium]|jgi:2-desacetyl-2-hydroxyethyl bacteriochlorophyllide A dehydrogenase|nr:alcohol dehydrogenase catalytic domain-containing protein [Thermoanaerobaculia bacterium]
MRAVRLTSPGARLRDEERAVPEPAPGEIVIEIRAAGICHTDAHYRRDPGRARLPVTPGHEIAGVVVEKAAGVELPSPGDRVAVHYLVGCGACADCRAGRERFCPRAEMIGKERDGGYAEMIAIPAENAIPVPDGVSFDEAAVMMCSSATALHALRLAEIRPGESVLVSGFGGLGASAVQLAGVLGAGAVIVSDVVPAKLSAARDFGAHPLDASAADFAESVAGAAGGRGPDVALDFAGTPASRSAALRALAPGGRLVIVALDARPFSFDPYRDVLSRERRIIGCSDHTRADLRDLMEFAAAGKIDPSRAITRRVPLEAAAIDRVLDELEAGTGHLRSVILPAG